MRRFCRCTRRRRFTKASAGRIDSTFDAVGKSSSHHATEDSTRIKSTVKDHRNGRHKGISLCNHDVDGKDPVTNGHKGNDNSRNLGNAADSARNNSKKQESNDAACNRPGNAKAVFKSHGNIVGARSRYKDWYANAAEQGKNNGHKLTQGLMADASLHIEIGAAAVLAILTDLVDLT